MPFELKMFVMLAIISMLQMTTADNISMLVSLPLHQASGPRTSWERGLEILPGALLAVNDINNDSSLFSGHTLKLLVVDSGRDEFEIVRHFVNLTFYQQVNITGLGGILDPKAIPALLPLVEREGVLLSAITHMGKLNHLDYDGVFYLCLLHLPWPVYC